MNREEGSDIGNIVGFEDGRTVRQTCAHLQELEKAKTGFFPSGPGKEHSSADTLTKSLGDPSDF